MKQFLDQLPAIVVVNATTLLAMGLGIVLIYVITAVERRGRWNELSKPPGEIVRLVTGDVDYVVVETDGGATYEVFCNDDEEDYPCLQEVEPPADVDPMRCHSQEFPLPTGQVKDRLLTCSGQEYIINSQYILREDGSL